MNNNSTEGYLTKPEVLEFQSLFKKVYGKTLSYEEAEDQGTRLVILFELLLKRHKDVLENEKH